MLLVVPLTCLYVVWARSLPVWFWLYRFCLAFAIAFTIVEIISLLRLSNSVFPAISCCMPEFDSSKHYSCWAGSNREGSSSFLRTYQCILTTTLAYRCLLTTTVVTYYFLVIFWLASPLLRLSNLPLILEIMIWNPALLTTILTCELQTLTTTFNYTASK